jgi:hypothetical protein
MDLEKDPTVIVDSVKWIPTFGNIPDPAVCVQNGQGKE